MTEKEQQLVYELNSTEADRILWKTTAIKQGNAIAELKAQVNCLREALTNAAKAPNHTFYYTKEALEATPEQCLAEVKAKAIEEYKQEQAEMKQMELATKLRFHLFKGGKQNEQTN